MSKAMKLSLLFALSLSASVAQAQTALIPKQLSGPPEEFAQMRAPDPAQAAVISKSALLPIELSDKSAAAIRLPVENGKLRFALFSGGADWQPELASPSGQPLIAQKMAGGAKATRLGLADNAYPATEYTLEGLQRGQWTLTLRPANRLAKSQAQRGYVLMEGEASTELASYPTHRRQWVGNSLGFTAVLSGSAQKGIVQNSTVLGAAAGRIQRGSLRVIAPDGSESRWPMSDDGRRGDAVARDGIYGGTFTPSATGTYVVQVVVHGIDRDGAAFVRTAEHVVPVIAPGLKLGASPVGAVSAGGTRMSLGIPVTGNLDPARRYRVFAEVWGRGTDGRQVPVAWIGGMASAKGRQLPLGLDQRWIQRAGARAPFSLRNVRIEDADYFIPVASAGSLSLTLPGSVATLAKRGAVVDESMVMGPRPAALVQTKAGTGSRLILVHGYCSGGVWPQSQFTNASSFLDTNQNRSHDQFAQLLKNYGSTWNSFGTVAHSQGGAAALHLYAYYWSGLDNATGNRLMQSVGTPYQGTNLSGIIATVGSWFGVACGSNYDMTYDGASAWLAGIPSWARAKVNYYTTSFKSTNWWTNDYCNFASDLVLSDPEDGTTEKAYGQLPGAVNQGHVTGQCHTTGMRDPAQYLDAGRNGVMNSNAAR